MWQLLLSTDFQPVLLTFFLPKYLLYIIYEIGSLSHLTGRYVVRLHWGNLKIESFDHTLGREQ